MKFILRAVGGSHAHGLATENSDVDMHGVYSVPTRDILALKNTPDSITNSDPDESYHELAPYLRQAVKGGANALELLWTPPEEEECCWGEGLRGIRGYLLSARAVKGSYLGYAEAQMKRLRSRAYEGSPKYNKLLKHAFRLLDQGTHLYTTGEMIVKVSPEDRDFLLNTLPSMSQQRLEEEYESRLTRFVNAETVLNESPDMDVINNFLLEYREDH